MEESDTNYQLKKDSATELVDYWKKNQKQLEKFWEVWKMISGESKSTSSLGLIFGH